MYALFFVRMLIVSVMLIAGALFSLTGCFNLSKTWHERFGWMAEEYFDDPKVVALCHAIEANDLEAIDRLAAEGADICCRGAGNMTPLLWAFPDNQLPRFIRLLEHGADPNVPVENTLNTGGHIQPGFSVVELAARENANEYFEAVMTHGGDPNFKNPRTGDSLTHAVIRSLLDYEKKRVRIQQLIEAEADLDAFNKSHRTPVMFAIGYGGQYEIALMLLQSHANPKVHSPATIYRLVHCVVSAERSLSDRSLATPPALKEIKRILDEQGESFVEAQSDLDRWHHWAFFYGPEKISELERREVEERMASDRSSP